MTKEEKIKIAIIEDKQLCLLYAELTSIHLMAVPRVVLRNGEAKTIWIDSTNNQLRQKVELLIKNRIEKIIAYYDETN